jgi:hypothetical protein
MGQPSVFHPENCAPRSFGRGSQVEGDMIRRGPGQGGDGRVRERKAPLRVDKDSIKASQDWGVLLVGLGELPVQERDFHKTEVVNKIIKQRSLGGVEVVIGLIARGSGKIEITQDHDMPRERSKKYGQGRLGSLAFGRDDKGRRR